ncbi:MAG: extracellular solute-binding protein, partial [Chloroflexota bacterium]
DPRALALYTYEGEVLGYPWMLTTGQVFFNRALFDAAGRPTPDTLYRDGKWTWAALLEAAQALTRYGPDGRFEIVGLSYQQSGLWRLVIQSNGSDLFDDFQKPKKSRLDEPAAIQALEWMQDVILKHRVAWKVPEAEGLGKNPRDAVNLGHIAIHSDFGVPTATSSTFSQVLDQVGWVPFPKGPASAGKMVSDLTTEAQGIVRSSTHQDAAWLYARWYQKEWQKVRLLDKSNPRVASRSDLQDLSRAALPAPQDIWFELVKMGQARPVFPDWSPVSREILNPQLRAIWSGEAAPRSAALAAATQLNDYFAANPQ